MGRLTFEGNFCDIARCVGEYRMTSECADGPCSQRKVWERLKAYEDTGLMPEEVKDMVENVEARALLWFDKSFGIGAGRMMDLAMADKSGRLLVLPCKVGDTVYVINRHLNKVFECCVISVCVGHDSDNRNYIKTRWVGERGNESIRKWKFRQIGIYVFLTHEEAEKAIAADTNVGHTIHVNDLYDEDGGDVLKGGAGYARNSVPWTDSPLW